MHTYLAVCLNPTLQRTIVLDSLRPNEVNRSSEYFLDAAGKGVNAARVLGQLGASAVHLTHAGGREKERLLDLARSSGVDVRSVESNSEIRTCYTLLDRVLRTTTEIVEEPAPVSPETEEGVRLEFSRLLDDSDVLIIGGTKSPGYSDNLFADMVAEAKSRGARVVLDIRGNDLLSALELRPDVIKPNLAEFVGTFLTSPGEHVSEHTTDAGLLDRVAAKMHELYVKYGTMTVLTRGGHATLYFDGDGIRSQEPQKVEPVNTIGCGDSFTAGFTVCWMEGGSMDEAVRAGNSAAARNAMQIRPGTLR